MQLVTAMNAKIWRATGWWMVKTVRENIPAGMRMVVHWEGWPPPEMPAGVEVRDARTEQALEFFRRAQKHVKPGWKFDLRFAWKVFALAEHVNDRGLLVWLDADTEAKFPISEETLRLWLPEGKAVSYLGRKGSTSECGFLLFDMDRQDARDVLGEVVRVYRSGLVFGLPEWHDSYVFDWVRTGTIKPEFGHNLSPTGNGYEDVFGQSPLASYLTHHKGKRAKVKAARLRAMEGENDPDR